MGKATFDDGVPSNPKIVQAGATAAWLWFCGVIYCRRGTTDGFIPTCVVPHLSMGLKAPYAHAKRLVEVRLWHEVDGGYQVNGFLEWNPSKAQIDTYRANDRARKQGRHSQAEVHAGIRTESERNPSDEVYTRATHAGAKSKSLSKSESEKSDPPEKSARETNAIVPAWNPNGRIVHGRGLIGSHIGCYPTPDACGRGICLPSWLGATWMRQFSDPAEGERAIETFVRDVVGALPDGPVGDAPKDFWLKHWAARHGTAAPVALHSRTGDSLAAGKASLKRRLEKIAMGGSRDE